MGNISPRECVDAIVSWNKLGMTDNAVMLLDVYSVELANHEILKVLRSLVSDSVYASGDDIRSLLTHQIERRELIEFGIYEGKQMRDHGEIQSVESFNDAGQQL